MEEISLEDKRASQKKIQPTWRSSAAAHECKQTEHKGTSCILFQNLLEIAGY